MKKRRTRSVGDVWSNQRGVALLFYVLVLALFLLPLMASFLQQSSTFEKHSFHSRNIKEARTSAMDIVADIMRVLSLDYCLDHYSSAVYARRDVNGVNTFVGIPESSQSRITGTIDVSPHREEKSVYLDIEGTYSTQPRSQYLVFQGRTLDSQRVHAVLSFVNDTFRFGHVSHTDVTVNAAHPLQGQTVEDGMWVDGDLNVSAANVTFSGGPVVVRGNFTGGPSTTLTAGTTIYYSGVFSSGGGAYLGDTVNWAPDLDVLTPTPSYYKYYWNYYSVGDSTWTFRNVLGQCRCYYGAGTYWVVTATGSTIVNENGNLWLSGDCASKVTVLALGSESDPSKGVITISTNTSFGTSPSLVTRSMAVIASKQLVFQKVGGGALNVYGYFRAPDVLISDDAGVPTHLVVNGTLDYSTSLTSGGGSTLQTIRDPHLYKYSPPRLPEKHTLASWSPQG